MSLKKINRTIKKQIKGASMIEYIVGLSALVVALSVVPVSNGLSAIELLELALKEESSGYSNSISSPR
jgi:Flp pilus assembly pilin Flp